MMAFSLSPLTPGAGGISRAHIIVVAVVSRFATAMLKFISGKARPQYIRLGTSLPQRVSTLLAEPSIINGINSVLVILCFVKPRGLTEICYFVGRCTFWY